MTHYLVKALNRWTDELHTMSSHGQTPWDAICRLRNADLPVRADWTWDLEILSVQPIPEYDMEADRLKYEKARQSNPPK